MARLSIHSPLAGTRGSVGKEIVFKQYKNKTVVSKYPDMTKVKASVRQHQQRKLFKEAMLFAGIISRSAELSDLYKQDLQEGESLFHYAKREYLNRLKD